MNNFKNETGYTKRTRKQLQHNVVPQPRLQMTRPLFSRQQDPLLANVTAPPLTNVPVSAPQVQVQTPPVTAAAITSAATSPPTAASPDAPTPPPTGEESQDVPKSPAPAVNHHSPMHSNNQGEPPPPG